MSSHFVLFVLMLCASMVGSVDRPRGVSIEKMSLYNPSRPFTCFDGSFTIEFERVNDDYCDCADGSDEPGTSACPNGFFTCPNKGHTPLTIPSSRVNDGICDCCDGSDEYDKHELCENTCLELGRALREELEKTRARLIEGNAVYLEYAAQGEKARTDNKARLEELLKDKEEVDQERKELEVKKNEAEGPEKDAKAAHEKAWQEVVEKRNAEIDEANAEAAFRDLDVNSDNSVSYEELMTKSEYDTNGDGDVTEDEAKGHLQGDAVDIDTFKSTVWPNIKSIYRKPDSEEATPTEETPTGAAFDDEEELETETLNDEEKDDEDEDEEFVHDKIPEEPKTEDENSMPDYNEETKKLIEAADSARLAFDEIDNKYNEIQKEIRELEEMSNIDFGPKDAFYPLKGQCLEFTDREYTYKLCPFDRASQRSKDGGSETSLGRWGTWAGPAEDRFSAMKYEGGQNCWNGPDRSLTVSLHCGVKNELMTVTEPSRCEYHAHLYTPALCDKIPPPVEKDPQHDEL